jgi:hypothetical protein
MRELEIVFDPLPNEALRSYVIDSLDAHNIAATGLSAWHPVGFFLKSPHGEWLGGLLGSLWGGWLHVRFFGCTRQRAARGTARGCFTQPKRMPLSAAALLRHWRPTASRRGRSTKNMNIKSSPRWTLGHRDTRNSSCVSSWQQATPRVFVIPAKAEIQGPRASTAASWTPAFAGVTSHTVANSARFPA